MCIIAKLCSISPPDVSCHENAENSKTIWKTFHEAIECDWTVMFSAKKEKL